MAVEEVEGFKKSGRLTGGMLPKIDACVRALQGGVRRTHIINGLKPGALLREVFTNAGPEVVVSASGDGFGVAVAQELSGGWAVALFGVVE